MASARYGSLRSEVRTGPGDEQAGPLKHGFHGYWSCHITDEHRLIHKAVDDEVRVAACRYHYGR
ncbi:type II toxin-antitoxin system YoeB family toxin [Streptomyces sp. CAI 127]|nr:type II toxin-antitoxin system YoeB family toxin [Streptomyces sp. CAI 127]